MEDLGDHPIELNKGSSAVGRYQINVPTWKDFKDYACLDNFKPESQDNVAVEIIKFELAKAKILKDKKLLHLMT